MGTNILILEIRGSSIGAVFVESFFVTHTYRSDDEITDQHHSIGEGFLALYSQ